MLWAMSPRSEPLRQTGWFELGAIPAVLFLGFFFLPVYMNAGIQTTPDYLERRYGPKCRTFVVIHALLIYVFTKVSVTLYAGQLILGELTSANKFLATLILVLGTAAYTVVGGLGAVVYTEALQTIVLLIGGFVVLIFSWTRATSLVDVFEHFENTNQVNFFHLFRPLDDENYPWYDLSGGYLFEEVKYP